MNANVVSFNPGKTTPIIRKPVEKDLDKDYDFDFDKDCDMDMDMDLDCDKPSLSLIA